MTKRAVDHKALDMSDLEHAEYLKIVAAFTAESVKGSEYFHDAFDVDEDGCITMIRPPVGRQIPWAVIVFLQNLMINQQERRRDRVMEHRLAEIEKKVKEMINGQENAG